MVRRRIKFEAPRGLAAIHPRAWGSYFDVMMFGDGDLADPKFTKEGPYAVVEIVGPLSKSASYWGDSYEQIRDRVQAAFESSSEIVCLKIDSPGGDYAGCMELTRDLRSMADGSDKPLIAFTDGECCSAAYAIASAASEIVATPQAFAGSVGVWAAHVDITARDALCGYKVTIIASDEAKSDWNDHVGLTEAAFARLKAQIDQQAAVFYSLIGEMRGRDLGPIAALKGASVFGQAALDAGLVDRFVDSWSAFVAGDFSPSHQENGMPPKTRSSKYDDALAAIKKCAEGDDDDAKKAKKLLAAADEPTEEDKKKQEEEAAEEEKNKDEEAKALAASNLALARTVQELKAAAEERAVKEKAQADATARAALFAQRPDFGPEVRAALEKLPIAELEKAVKTFPRVAAAPGSAAGAQTPAVTGGERAPQSGARPLSPEEQAVFDRTNPFKRAQGSAKGRFEGREFVMPARILSREESAARAAELEREFGFGAGGVG